MDSPAAELNFNGQGFLNHIRLKKRKNCDIMYLNKLPKEVKE